MFIFWSDSYFIDLKWDRGRNFNLRCWLQISYGKLEHQSQMSEAFEIFGSNRLLFVYFVFITLNVCIWAENGFKRQESHNKIKTSLESDRCPVEYQSICKCKSDTSLSQNSLSIHVICSLSKNGANASLKAIPRINLSSYKFVEFLTHIDLSSTLIKEIPTDGFNVCFLFSFFK